MITIPFCPITNFLFFNRMRCSNQRLLRLWCVWRNARKRKQRLTVRSKLNYPNTKASLTVSLMKVTMHSEVSQRQNG